MKFINNGEAVQVRESEGENRYKWTVLKKGETIELPEKVGKRYGFKKVSENSYTKSRVEPTEGKIGKTKVETKQIDKVVDNIVDDTPDDLFLKELIKIKGIAKKTAKDIMRVFTKEKLIEAIILKEELPFRDDIEIKLREKYGGKND